MKKTQSKYSKKKLDAYDLLCTTVTTLNPANIGSVIGKIKRSLRSQKPASDVKTSFPPHRTRTHECKNKLWELLNDARNISVNGYKDSKYNDLIAFERHFEQYDDDLLILHSIAYGKHDDGSRYVYHSVIGIFDNIGMLARALIEKLPYERDGKTVSAMYFGDHLDFTISTKDPIFTSQYRVTFGQKNDTSCRRSFGDFKWSLPDEKPVDNAIL